MVKYNMHYKHRYVETKISKYIEIFPVIALTGSRQAGKSTMLKHMFSDGWEYFTLDERSSLEMMREDPDRFFKRYDGNIIVDEAQKLPEIFSAVKFSVDSGRKGTIILSGSANFLLIRRVSESLAGRVGIVELYPYMPGELYEKPPSSFLDTVFRARSCEQLLESFKIEHIPFDSLVFNGGYPKVWEFDNRESRMIWFENFRTTFLERDLRDLSQVASLSDFQRYYEMLAYQVGGLINFSEVGRDIGVTTNTSKKYMSILNSAYQYFLLQPYYSNIGKRLVKRPKIFGVDTGFINFLLRYDSEREMQNSGKYGNILENWVILEIYKQSLLLMQKPGFYFWRTGNGAEVDLVLDVGKKIIPFEIKASELIKKESIKGLRMFLEDYQNRAPWGIVLYAGDRVYMPAENIIALPIEVII